MDLKTGFETVPKAQMPCKSPALWVSVFEGLELLSVGTLGSPAAKNIIG